MRFAHKKHLLGAVTIAAAWAVGAAVSVTSVLVYADSDEAKTLDQFTNPDAPLTRNQSTLAPIAMPMTARAIRVASLH